MQQEFIYLTAVIDLYSRFVMAWKVHNTLEAVHCREVIQEAVSLYGEPEIVNSDQGSQFTCKDWIAYLTKGEIQISMDGKGSLDNVFIERLWRTVKQDYVYLHSSENGTELYKGLKTFFQHYNHKKAHQGIGRKRPAEVYIKAA